MSHGILHYLWSGDLSKSSTQFVMSIFTFSRYFFNRFCLVEKCGVTPHCLYRDSLTLRNEYLFFFFFRSSNVGSFILIFCIQHYLCFWGGWGNCQMKKWLQSSILESSIWCGSPILLASTRFWATGAVWFISQDRLYRTRFEQVKLRSCCQISLLVLSKLCTFYYRWFSDD